MLAKKIIRLCAALVLSGVYCHAYSETLNGWDAINLIDNNGLAEVPENYTIIGENAFSNTSVKKVVLGENVTSIGNGAFAYTDFLSEVSLTSSITAIPENAFLSSGLEIITGLQNVQTIGENAFLGTKLEHVNLPDGVSVSKYAFKDIQTIKSILIGRNVSFGKEVFINSLSNLETIETFTNPSPSLNRDYEMFGVGFKYLEDAPKLKLVIFRPSVGAFNSYENWRVAPLTDRCFSNSNAKLIVEGNLSTLGEHKINYGQVVLVKPQNDLPKHFFSTGVLFSLCDSIDLDDDGYFDCYDHFPNDPDRWFDYSDTEETNPNSSGLVHSDSDGLADIFDTYPTTNNIEGFGEDKDQSGYELDTDYDGINNHYDIDDDDDGLIDIYEPFFGTNPLIPDSDFDGTLDGLDAFPLDNAESLDTDTDGIGNNADTDDDNDGHFDLLDAFPLDASEWMDSDLDGVGNNADTDDDNDGVLDEEDAFPYTASESVDTDGDGVGDNSDAFPNDSSETLDTDLDGIGNNADDDDDNDGVADTEDSDPLNDAIGALESQNLFVMGNPVAVNGYLTTISVGYDVSDDNNQLTGIGFRVHYDSSIYSYSAVESTINESLIVDGMGPYQDIEDFDNDSTTDSYIVFGWAAVNADWPNIELPAKLTDIQLFVNWDDYDAGSTTSNINFSIVDNAEGYEAKTTNYAMTVLPATWDFDGNGSADALTDGLMLLRYTFGIRDLRMASGAMAQNSTLSATQVVDNMHRAISVADIDGNGSTDALTDGLILLRYLFGLRGENLISGAISSDATRTTQEQIEQYLSLYMPNELALPVQSEQSFLVGDWKLASLPEKREYDENGVLGGWGDDDISGLDSNVYDMCVVDDIYTFGSNGTFNYSWNGSTYIHPDQNPMFSWADSNYCAPRIDPWDDASSYSYNVDENNGELTVIGLGAYIALSHVANGNNEVDTPAEAPDSITYSFTKLSEDQILIELDAYHEFYRFALERVPSN